MNPSTHLVTGATDGIGLMAGFGSRGASLERGARTSVYCAIDPALEEVLWEKSMELVGGSEG